MKRQFTTRPVYFDKISSPFLLDSADWLLSITELLDLIYSLGKKSA